MQILQEKGKHANGPYGLRVWGRVRRKEEVTWVLGGPAPDVFPVTHLRGRGRPPLPLGPPANRECSPPVCESWPWTTGWCHADQKLLLSLPERKLFGRIQRNLKNMIFHPNGGKFETQTETPTASVRRRWWGTGREQGHGNGTVVGHRGAYLPSPAAVRCSISQDSGD